MTLNPKLTKLLNEQINNEMSSSYVYLAMAGWFERTPYAGFAQWMFAQSGEETMHALKFYQYLVDRDAKIELQPIAKPKMAAQFLFCKSSDQVWDGSAEFMLR